ncbi:MAG TPA: hypothetical protein VFQ85_13335 [Mycobacteriales bacterium]|jgi:hypothetical protein|nr:hypothetical protein [Mycobacteriales bacterium]
MRRSSLAAVAALATVTLAACGSSAPARHGAAPVAATSGVPAATSTASTRPGHAGSVPTTAPAGRSGTTGTNGTTGSAQPPAAGTAGTTPSTAQQQPPSYEATPEELPIEAAVLPACVPAGGVAKLTVHTVKKAALAFVAVYAGNKSGAAPPWGQGYGGNDKGTADTNGDWSATWTVAVNTPPGPANVILVAGSKGKQRQITVPFTVGGGAGGCAM